MRLQRPKLRNVFSLTLAVFTAWMLFDSLSLSRVAAMLPQVIIAATLLLIGVQWVLDLGKRRGIVSGTEQSPPDQQAPQLRFLLSLLWIALLSCCTWLLGLVFGPALFSFVFLRGFASESWLLSIAYSVILALVISFIFAFLLNTSPYEGVLSGMML